MSYAPRVKNKLRKIKRYYIPPNRPEALILMYHRVRSQAIDPWEMCVTEENFTAQMELLASRFRVHPLSRIHEVLEGKPTRDRNIFITFDDGYLDNYTTAAPQLRRLGLGATFFIPTAILGEGPDFWWEAVDQLFWNQRVLPEVLHLSAGPHVFHQSVPHTARDLQPEIESGWSANTTLPPTARCELYLNLCSWIKEMEPACQQMITSQLLALSAPGAGDPECNAKMSVFQMHDLRKTGFELGSHTVHHPALGYHNRDTQLAEIRGGNKTLSALTGKPVTTFAYPHGDYNADTPEVLAAEGISLGCTVDPGVITRDSDMLTLPRLFVKNWGGREFKYHVEETFIRKAL